LPGVSIEALLGRNRAPENYLLASDRDYNFAFWNVAIATYPHLCDLVGSSLALRLLADGSDLKSSKDWVRFAKHRRFSPLLLGRLSKAHAWSATVRVDELDAGSLQGSSDCLIIGSG
jgi:hypothetical protein